jgi:SNF2 family DNA or RNA helicase
VKTSPMKHQAVNKKRLARSDIWALGDEQGTGKTWVLLADAEARWRKGQIDGVLVIAPNGVHVNWVVREVPKHLEVPYTATAWRSGASKKQLAAFNYQLIHAFDEPRVLTIHAMNIDAVNTKSGQAHATAFLAAFKGHSIMIVDESHTIKNPLAKRTQRVIALGRKATARRISSGTIVANSPLDIFSQYDFLEPGLLGTTSYRAFVSEYAELLPSNSGLVQDIMRKQAGRGGRVYEPQIVAKNPDGTMKFRNLAKLSALMAPYTSRFTKAQCLDLPEKVYQTRYFDMLPEQWKAYNQVLNERNWFRDDGSLDTFTALTVITKLRQITSGFILEEGVPKALAHSGPRLDVLRDFIEETPGPMIIWASFQEEIRQIAEELTSLGESFREYHGLTKPRDRTAAIDDFQSGRARFFLSNPAAGSTGLTLTAAESAVYYSSDFSLVKRIQSEDRCHRIGTLHHVLYLDLAARDTIDERIAAALQSKSLTAAAIMAGI